MKDRIKKSALSAPVYSVIIYSLLAVAIFSVPNTFTLKADIAFLLHAVCRIVVIVFALILAKILGFSLLNFKKITAFGIILLLLGTLVCLNNFPFIGFISGNVKLNDNANIVRYACYCVLVGASEETVFRALNIPLLQMRFNDKKRRDLAAVLISAAVFSLCHLFNLFSSGIGATALQIGYTFLTGGLFGITFIITGNFLLPCLMHAVFDIGGLMFGAPFPIASGNMWDVKTVIITAVLGVIATAAFVVYILKQKNGGAESSQRSSS